MCISYWRNVLFLCLVSLICLYSSGCSESVEQPDAESEITDKLLPNTTGAKLISGVTTFEFKLFAELVNQSGLERNIFISPTSIAIALSMTYNGAAGETQQAMAKVLEVTGMTLQEVNQKNASLIAALENADQDVQLNIANSLWAMEGWDFKEDFIKRNEDFYGAEVANLDFGDPKSPDVINGWVSDKTNGKIDSIIDTIDFNTILFIINAIYFKGTWTVEFDSEKTSDGDFSLADGSKKKVPMMASKTDYMYCWDEKFEAISLPYGSGRVSMYIFLPSRDSSLEEFYKGLNERNWQLWMSRFNEMEIEIVLPKFKLEYEVSLNKVLKALGMEVAFGPKADFTGMSPKSPWIDEVKHKTFVEVNEQGTEAAAVTVVVMMLSMPARMVVDRPFFCAIRDNETGTIIFMGSIVEP